MKPPSPKQSPVTPPEELDSLPPSLPPDAPVDLLPPSIMDEVPDAAFEEPARTPLSEEGSIFESSSLEPDLADKLNLLKSFSGLDEFSQELEIFLKNTDFRELDESSISQITTFLASLLSSEIRSSALETEIQLSSQDSQTDDMDITLVPSAQVTLFRLSIEEPSILLLMQKLYQFIPEIGFTFLVYLSVAENEDFKIYFEYNGSEECKEQLVRDLTLGATENIDTFFKLLPKLYRECSEQMVGCVEVLKIVVSNLDPSNLYKLVCGLTMQDFSIFGQNNIEQVNNISINTNKQTHLYLLYPRCCWLVWNGRHSNSSVFGSC